LFHNSIKKKYNAAMSTSTGTSRRRTFSPIVYLFIPLSFFLGLGGGYLLWGGKQVTPTTGTDQVRRVTVSTDGEPSIGPANAPVTIVEFSDYQCPYCQVWDQQVYAQLMASYPNQIRFVYRDLPLPMHPEAVPAAEAADCAGEQNAYWKYHDALFGQQYGLGRQAYEKYAADLGLDIQAFTTCLDSHRYVSEIQSDASDAAKVGLDSTPSFVINGQVLIGAQPLETFKAVVDQELKNKH
jgi:protein-disulfide isomerase